MTRRGTLAATDACRDVTASAVMPQRAMVTAAVAALVPPVYERPPRIPAATRRFQMNSTTIAPIVAVMKPAPWSGL
jgi:hypothetical protein